MSVRVRYTIWGLDLLVYSAALVLLLGMILGVVAIAAAAGTTHYPAPKPTPVIDVQLPTL